MSSSPKSQRLLVLSLLLIPPAVGLIYSILATNIYSASALVNTTRLSEPGVTRSYWPDEPSIIQSRKVIYPVFEELNLSEKLTSWNKLKDPTKDSLYETFRQKHLKVGPWRDSTGVLITVECPDPHSAASLANAIAASHRREFVKEIKEQQQIRIRTLKIQILDEKNKKEAAYLKTLPGSGSPEARARERQNVEIAKSLIDHKEKSLKQLEIEAMLPPQGGEIVSAAEVPTKPIRPIASLYVGLGAVLGIVLTFLSQLPRLKRKIIKLRTHKPTTSL